MPKDNLPEPKSEIAKILDATLKGKDLNSLSATCEISQYQKELGKQFQEIIDGGGGGGTPVSPKWGNITGTLSDQEDLQNALNTASTSPSWGDITGTLSDQEDLQSALATASAPPFWGTVTGDITAQSDLKTALDTAETKATFNGITGSLEDNTVLKNKIDDIEESITQKAEVRHYTVNILADNWTASGQPLQPTFFQNVTVTGILETDHPKVDIFFSDDPFADVRSQIDAYSCLTEIVTTNNHITLICLDKKPEVDFTIQMEVVS